MHTMKKFIRYYAPYKAVFFLDLICAAIISLVDLAFPQILRSLTKTLFTEDPSQILGALLPIGLALLVMYIIQTFCKYYVSYQGHMMGAHMERDMRQKLFDHYERLSFSYYDQNNSGQMMSKLVSDLFDISEFAHHGPENLFISVIKIVGSFTFLFLINWRLAIPLLVMVVFMLIFLALTAWIVFRGVEKGIEKFSRIIMPGLILLIVIIAIFSLTLSHTDTDGTVRTGMQGLAVYLKPDFHGLTVKRFLEILLDAMSQLFFSLSVSMGIMITYGSYVKNEVNLNKATNQIEIFDTGVAFLAGMMIIPAVFVFLGKDGMASGPSLIFISLPKVFDAMGVFGRPVAIAFFLMMGFAALTSCVSVMETLVANCMELYHKPRKKMCGAVGIYSLVTAVLICLGYNKLYFELKLPNGSVGQLLDVMDYISNSFLMPFISLLTSILIGWVIGPDWIIGEVERNGEHFKRAGLYRFMIRYVVPVVMLILFLVSTGFADLIS